MEYYSEDQFEMFWDDSGYQQEYKKQMCVEVITWNGIDKFRRLEM